MTEEKALTAENLALMRALEKAEYIVDKDIRDGIIKDLVAIGRAQRKRIQKQESDGRNRVLIGAMVPKWNAERYRRMAKSTDRSMYQFVRDALSAEYRRTLSNLTSGAGRHEKRPPGGAPQS